MTNRYPRRQAASLLVTLLLGFAVSAQALAADSSAAEEETAQEFIARINAEIAELRVETAKAFWVQATYITPDTNFLAAKASEKILAFNSRAIAESARYIGQDLDPDTARQLELLRRGTSLPAPDDAAKRAELATIATGMEGMYGAAKFCPEGEECISETDIIRFMAENRDYDRLLAVWRG